MAILDELRREFGLAMLFITHDLELAAAICDRTAVMYAGRIVEIRDSDAAAQRPVAPVHRRAVRRTTGHRPDDALGCRRSPDVRCRRSRRRRRSARSRARCPHAAGCVPVRRTRPGRARRRQHALRPGARAARPAGGDCAWLSRRRRPILEVSGLRKEFGDLVAVDDVSFSVPAGRSLAIVGESGSGKSTIARMIVGLERPTTGVDRRLRRGPVATGPAREGPAAPRPRGADRLPGPLHQPRPAAERRGDDRRGAASCTRAGRPSGAGSGSPS